MSFASNQGCQLTYHYADADRQSYEQQLDVRFGPSELLGQELVFVFWFLIVRLQIAPRQPVWSSDSESSSQHMSHTSIFRTSTSHIKTNRDHTEESNRRFQLYNPMISLKPQASSTVFRFGTRTPCPAKDRRASRASALAAYMNCNKDLNDALGGPKIGWDTTSPTACRKILHP